MAEEFLSSSALDPNYLSGQPKPAEDTSSRTWGQAAIDTVADMAGTVVGVGRAGTAAARATENDPNGFWAGADKNVREINKTIEAWRSPKGKRIAEAKLDPGQDEPSAWNEPISYIGHQAAVLAPWLVVGAAATLAGVGSGGAALPAAGAAFWGALGAGEYVKQVTDIADETPVETLQQMPGVNWDGFMREAGGDEAKARNLFAQSMINAKDMAIQAAGSAAGGAALGRAMRPLHGASPGVARRAATGALEGGVAMALESGTAAYADESARTQGGMQDEVDWNKVQSGVVEGLGVMPVFGGIHAARRNHVAPDRVQHAVDKATDGISADQRVALQRQVGGYADLAASGEMDQMRSNAKVEQGNILQEPVFDPNGPVPQAYYPGGVQPAALDTMQPPNRPYVNPSLVGAAGRTPPRPIEVPEVGQTSTEIPRGVVPNQSMMGEQVRAARRAQPVETPEAPWSPLEPVPAKGAKGRAAKAVSKGEPKAETPVDATTDTEVVTGTVPNDLAAAFAAVTEQQADVVTSIWSNKDHDIPVRIIEEPPQAGPDGRMYQKVEYNGQQSYVPADELKGYGRVAASAPGAKGEAVKTKSRAKKTDDGKIVAVDAPADQQGVTALVTKGGEAGKRKPVGTDRGVVYEGPSVNQQSLVNVDYGTSDQSLLNNKLDPVNPARQRARRGSGKITTVRAEEPAIKTAGSTWALYRRQQEPEQQRYRRPQTFGPAGEKATRSTVGRVLQKTVTMLDKLANRTLERFKRHPEGQDTPEFKRFREEQTKIYRETNGRDGENMPADWNEYQLAVRKSRERAKNLREVTNLLAQGKSFDEVKHLVEGKSKQAVANEARTNAQELRREEIFKEAHDAVWSTPLRQAFYRRMLRAAFKPKAGDVAKNTGVSTVSPKKLNKELKPRDNADDRAADARQERKSFNTTPEERSKETLHAAREILKIAKQQLELVQAAFKEQRKKEHAEFGRGELNLDKTHEVYRLESVRSGSVQNYMMSHGGRQLSFIKKLEPMLDQLKGKDTIGNADLEKALAREVRKYALAEAAGAEAMRYEQHVMNQEKREKGTSAAAPERDSTGRKNPDEEDFQDALQAAVESGADTGELGLEAKRDAGGKADTTADEVRAAADADEAARKADKATGEIDRDADTADLHDDIVGDVGVKLNENEPFIAKKDADELADPLVQKLSISAADKLEADRKGNDESLAAMWARGLITPEQRARAEEHERTVSAKRSEVETERQRVEREYPGFTARTAQLLRDIGDLVAELKVNGVKLAEETLARATEWSKVGEHLTNANEKIQAGIKRTEKLYNSAKTDATRGKHSEYLTKANEILDRVQKTLEQIVPKETLRKLEKEDVEYRRAQERLAEAERIMAAEKTAALENKPLSDEAPTAARPVAVDKSGNLNKAEDLEKKARKQAEERERVKVRELEQQSILSSTQAAGFAALADKKAAEESAARTAQMLNRDAPLSSVKGVRVSIVRDIIDTIRASQTGLDRYFNSVVKKVAGDVEIAHISDGDFAGVVRSLKPDMSDVGVDNVAALYDWKSDRIFIREGLSGDREAYDRAIRHEVGHAVTEGAFRKRPHMFKQLDELRRIAIQRLGLKPEALKDPDLQGFTSKQEFLSELWSNPEFAEMLSEISVKPNEEVTFASRRNNSVLGKAYGLIREVVGYMFGHRPSILRESLMESAAIFRQIENMGRPKFEKGDISEPQFLTMNEAAAKLKESGKTLRDMLPDTRNWRVDLAFSRLDQLAARGEDAFQQLTKPWFNTVAKMNSLADRISVERGDDALRQKIDAFHRNPEATVRKGVDLLYKESRHGFFLDENLGTGRNAHYKEGLGELLSPARHARLKADLAEMNKVPGFAEMRKAMHDWGARVEPASRYDHAKMAIASLDEVRGPDGKRDPVAVEAMVKTILNDKKNFPLTDAEQAWVDARRPEGDTAKDIERAKFDKFVSTMRQIPEWRRTAGPYLPHMRRGNIVISGRYKLPEIDASKGTKITDDNGHDTGRVEFFNVKDAEAYAQKVEDMGLVQLNTGRTVYDRATGKPATTFGEASTLEGGPIGEPGYVITTRGVTKKVTAKEAESDPDLEIRHWMSWGNKHFDAFENVREAERAIEGLRTAGVIAKDENSPGLVLSYPESNHIRDQSAGDLNVHQMSAELTNLMKRVERSPEYKAMSDAERRGWHQRMNAEISKTVQGVGGKSPMLPREFATGESHDIQRNYGEAMLSTAHRQAHARYATELQDQAEAVRKYIYDRRYHTGTMDRDAASGHKLRDDVWNTMQARVYEPQAAFVDGPVGNAMNRLMQMTYTGKLAGTSFLALNFTEAPVIGYPLLAAKYGAVGAARSMAKAYRIIGGGRIMGAGASDFARVFTKKGEFTDYSKIVMENLKKAKGLSEAERNEAIWLIDKLHEHGQFDRTAVNEVSLLRQTKPSMLGRTVDMVDQSFRGLNTAVESINRSVIGLTAYMEARKGGGKTKEQALQEAMDIVHKGAGVYAAWNSAPVFNNAYLRPMAQFKKYAQRIASNYIAAASNSLGSGPKANEARRQLFYMLAMQTAVAGLLGLPTEILSVPLNAAYMAGVSPINMDDAEAAFRKQAAELLGPSGGEVVSRGLGRAVNLGTDTRFSHAGLMFHGSPDDNKRATLLKSAANFIAGAPGDTAFGIVGGVQDIAKASGDFAAGATSQGYERLGGGIRKMLFVRQLADFYDAYAKSNPGVNQETRAGKPMGTKLEGGDVALQALGIRPRLAVERDEDRRATQRQINQFNANREAVIGRYVRATPGEQAAIRQGIFRDYNTSVTDPNQKITFDQLQRAKVAYEKNQKTDTSTLGITTNKRTKGILQENNSIYNIGS